MATTFTFEGEGFELQGAVEASVESVKQHNDIFDMEIGHYEGSVDFVQKVKAQSGTVINVMAEWMVCNDENSVTGERDFKIKLGEGVAPAVKAEVKSAIEKLRTTLGGGDTEAIKADTEALEKAFYALSEKLYKQSGAQGAGPDMGDMGGNGQNGDSTYYNADYEDKTNQ